ncbi:MAG: helix-hairpin-helix domain-containing protein [Sterolibacterium sp.]|nr:helix-hairpin-helix domain-containing protein [Sterolibacterium sp.]
MHHRIIKSATLAMVLLLSASLSLAVDKKTAVEPVMGEIEPLVKQFAAKSAKVPMARRVDVNTASKAALMKLPGIGAEEADKIIANRPYLTKSGLVTKNSIPMGTYHGIRNLVKVEQPENVGDKKAAPSAPKK